MTAIDDEMPNPLLAAGELPDFESIEPAHIRPAIQQVLEAERAELERLSAVESPSVEWLRETETMLERIYDVWNPVSHLNSVASTPELRDAYNDCLTLVTEFFSDMGQHEVLFSRFEALERTLDTEPEAELVRQALRDFRLAGVALEGRAKEDYRQVTLDLAARQAEFEQNLMDATDAFSHHETDRRNLAGIPSDVLERAATAAKESGLDGWLLKLDPPTYQTIISHAESGPLRETFYRAWQTRASDQGQGDWDNGPLIEEILALRQRQASLLGYENYAALSLAKKMAQSPDQVLDFLTDLAKRSRSVAKQEFGELESLAGHTLNAWDVAFYSEKLKQKRFRIGEEELRAYFPLPKVLTGLFDLAERLFGIRLEEQAGARLWHESARCFRLETNDGQTVGTLLTDFYARPNKRGGAWMDNCMNRSRLGRIERAPIAHLVCNFAPPAADRPSYVTHDDVVTLFHEFGHALHHLLTEVDYPSIAGINGVAWDAVELPSQFFENYGWHPDVLRGISSHRDTGEPLPEDKIRTLIESRTFLAGLAMLRQLEFALFDFRLHARTEPATQAGVQALLDEVRADVAVTPIPSFNRFQCSFSHIFAGGYAAGYYSYKWAEVLAADAFSAFEESGAFDRETADRFRRSILAVGGSRDAMDSFVAFRGREPELDPLLRLSGLAA